MSKVSIIVAVFNGEPFISRCVESLTQQTHRDLQMIFVDDGSTDRSLSLLRDYAARDSRMEVYALAQNKGLPHARNEGLRHVTGDYVGTLDVDDWLSPDAIEQGASVLDQHEQTDCVLFRLVSVDSDGTTTDYPIKPFTCISGEEAMKRSLDWQDIHGLYLIRRELHLKYPFDTTTRVYADENTARFHFKAAREVRSCGGIYFYRKNPQSITNKASLSYYDHLRANENLRKQLISMGIDNETRQRLASKLWFGVVDCYYFYYTHRHQHDAKGRKYALAEIKRAWQNAPVSEVPARFRFMVGYWPLRWSWTMFRIQEEVYFFLRRKIKGV